MKLVNTRKKSASSNKMVSREFQSLLDTIAKLRCPNDGCPWDRKQTHQTLRKYMLEEAYEASEAMESGDPDHIAEELGDVLLQVVLNSQIASETEDFSIIDVIRKINDKMISRHPHVFGNRGKDASDLESLNDSFLRKQWQEIKNRENKKKAKDAAISCEKPIFSDVKGILPASSQALAIGKIAKEIKFDWVDPLQVFEQLKSEVAELEVELVDLDKNQDDIRKELGDIYFTLAQVCRHLKIDPEVISQNGNIKFLRRFSLMEKIAKNQNIDLIKASQEKKEELWKQAKKIEIASS